MVPLISSSWLARGADSASCSTAPPAILLRPEGFSQGAPEPSSQGRARAACILQREFLLSLKFQTGAIPGTEGTPLWIWHKLLEVSNLTTLSCWWHCFCYRPSNLTLFLRMRNTSALIQLFFFSSSFKRKKKVSNGWFIPPNAHDSRCVWAGTNCGLLKCNLGVAETNSFNHHACLPELALHGS